MALTEKQKEIAWDAYCAGGGSDGGAYAAVEAVLADQGADLNAKYVQGFEDCRAQAMNVVDEHDGFLQRIEFLKPAPIAEQARAAEQGQDEVTVVTYKKSCGQPCSRWCYKEGNDLQAVCDDCGELKPAQPPVGDAQMVERMCDAYVTSVCGSAPHCGVAPQTIKGMAAALAVAREGYVSLEDVDEAIRCKWPYTKDRPSEFMSQIHDKLDRLAKPAARVTDEQKVAAMLNDSRMDGNDLSRRLLAKKIVAALRNGKEGK